MKSSSPAIWSTRSSSPASGEGDALDVGTGGGVPGVVLAIIRPI
jgi:16S rRNA G527 N7-methylase RsmG